MYSPPTFLYLFLLGVALLMFLWFVPVWQVKRTQGGDPSKGEAYISLVNATRQTWAHVLAGIFFLVTAYFTWRTVTATDKNVTIANENLRIANQNLEVAKNGQITDRFTKAVDQLAATGADKESTLPRRIGAIYALERVALDSPAHHWPVMEVLTAYARLNAKWDGKRKESDDYPEDMRSILLVVGRRDRSHPELGRLDLRFVDLTGADLQELHLENTYLYGAHLEGAYMRNTYIRGAVLTKSHVEGTDLRQCDITQEQLDSVYTDSKTMLSPALRFTPGPPKDLLKQ